MSLHKQSLEPILWVDMDETVAQCAEKMKKESKSSILIKTAGNEIAGIFTERDLMMKSTAPGFWEMPIHKVMSRPVTVLPESLSHLAPEVMLSKNIRHVPIVSNLTASPEFLGVLTMQNVFFDHLENENSWRDFQLSQIHNAFTFGVISEDSNLNEKLVDTLNQRMDIFARQIKRKEMVSLEQIHQISRSFHYLIVDLDHMDSRKWARILLNAIHSDSIRKVFLAYTPALHDESSLAVIRSISNFEKFMVRTKPISIEDIGEMIGLEFHSEMASVSTRPSETLGGTVPLKKERVGAMSTTFESRE